VGQEADPARDALIAQVALILAAWDDPDRPEAAKSYADLAEEIVHLILLQQERE